MDKLLRIRNLRVEFGPGAKTNTAVEQADLDIGRNETLVLAGESGSGKTITALSITKVLPASARIISGSILFEDSDLLRLDEESLVRIRGGKIAYVFQEPVSYLNPVYTIARQIAETITQHQGKSRQEAIKEAISLLAKVKIRDPERAAFSYPHQLSGGMNQRAFIAMALACRPRLLIADEPTTSLDVLMETEILNLLMNLKQEQGFSLLFITHNLSIANRIADRICIMHRGRVVEEGSRESIFNSPRHAHTRELISAYERIKRA